MAEVVLVDEQDNVIGVEEKLRAHQDGGTLHRAFSIFLFDASGRILLQKRAAAKYHFGGLWTNACCSHAVPNEPLLETARRRLREEMGVDTSLSEAFTFVYRAGDARSGLTEHELDHVLIGHYDGDARPDPSEADDWTWSETHDVESRIASRPEEFSPWFLIAFRELRTRGL